MSQIKGPAKTRPYQICMRRTEFNEMNGRTRERRRLLNGSKKERERERGRTRRVNVSSEHGRNLSPPPPLVRVLCIRGILSFGVYYDLSIYGWGGGEGESPESRRELGTGSESRQPGRHDTRGRTRREPREQLPRRNPFCFFSRLDERVS